MLYVCYYTRSIQTISFIYFDHLYKENKLKLMDHIILPILKPKISRYYKLNNRFTSS